MTLRQTVFKLLPLCTQIVCGTPWTTAQADEAERLVLEITALSIVARNGGPWVETQQACGIERVDGANDAVPGPDPASMRECPFCGGVEVAVRQWRNSMGDEGCGVNCGSCDADGPTEADEESAIAAWNRRVQAEPIDDDGRVGPWTADEARRILR